jgi:hypothetical protein
MRGQEPDRVVAPVVTQPLIEQMTVLDKLVHRHQLDRGHPKIDEVLDRRRMRQAGIGAADTVRDVRMQLG